MMSLSQPLGQAPASDDGLQKNQSRWILPATPSPDMFDLGKTISLQIQRCAQNDGEKDFSWYLLFTRPRQERLVADRLAKQGLSTYLPMINAASAPSKTSGIACPSAFEPMLPRYLFCGLAQGQYIEMIRAASLSAVIHIVGLSCRPVDVTSILDNIRVLETQHLDEFLMDENNDVAYRDLKKLTSKKAHERIMALFEMFSQQMTVKLRSQLFSFA